MVRRATTTELRDRIDGLGLAFFAVMGAVTDVLIEVHPDEDEVRPRMAAQAFALLAGLAELEQHSFSAEALHQAFTALAAAVGVRVNEPEPGEPENDNNEH